MARNKKNESGIRAGPVVTALALLALLVPPGIGYVWFKDQIDVLGDQVKKKEVALAELEREPTAPGAINWPSCACPRPWTNRSRA